MADNVTVTLGSYSATVAADDIGGVHYQRAKIVWGPDGTANDTDVASGKPMPIQVRTPLGDSAMDDTLDAVKVTVASNGLTPYYKLSTGSNHATSVKAAAGTLFSVDVTNTNASARYIKFYNSTGAPTVGTTAIAFEYLVPGSTGGGGHSPNFGADGVAFSSGIAWAIATGPGTSTAAPAADEMIINLQYS